MDDLSIRQPHSNLQALTDRQLVNALTTLAALERASTARLVQTLAEFDRRRLYLPLGFTSLFAYCTNRLHMSQDEAFYRIEAARVARRYPLVLDYLGKGAITLRTARVLGPHLTDENHRQLLDAATHQKRPEVDMLLARLRPKPDVPPTIRKLPDAVSRTSDESRTAVGAVSGGNAVSAPAAEEGALPSQPASPGNVGRSVSPAGLGMAVSRSRDIPARRPIVAPLSDTSYRLQITMGVATHAALREIQSLVRHSIPNGDPAVIVARALELFLAHLRKRRMAETMRPRGHAPAGAGGRDGRDVGTGADGADGAKKATGVCSGEGRHIPAHVKRVVWKRDKGRCAFVAPDGTRCGADSFVEYHHAQPYARGGKATARNIELRCRAHNAYEAELAFEGRGTGRRRRR